MRIVKRLSERGDTLVEVLIAIAVISLILGGAFVMTNRSLQGTRDAQERVNATKLVEGQIEQIKNLAAIDSEDLFAATGSFCIDSTGTVVAASTAGCRVDSSGGTPTEEPIYSLAITRSGNTFTVRNTWADIRGSGQNNVEMKYRAYEAN